ITDGARTIRCQLAELFGQPVPVILDWYHLDKKVRELMSMVARTKQEKAVHVARLLDYLWHGRTAAALAYLQTAVHRLRPPPTGGQTRWQWPDGKRGRSGHWGTPEAQGDALESDRQQ